MLVDEANVTVRKLIVKFIVTIIDIIFFSTAVYFLWNYLAPGFGITQIVPQQAIGLFLLSRFLLKDHLLSSEPTIVHCDCEEEDENEEEAHKTSEV